MDALKRYLAKNNLTQENFARKIGRTQALISQWYCGVRPISPEAALDIHEATKGEVRCEVLRPDIFERYRKLG